MNPKHTPGPWTVNDMSTNYVIYSPNRVQARTDHHTDADQANAQLIAAAPEMFELLLELACSKSVFAKDAQLLVRRIRKGGSNE